MTNYAISDADGIQLTAGLQEHNARKVAQDMANAGARSVYLWAEGSGEETDDDAGEEFEPTTEGYSADADEAIVSALCPGSKSPAYDVDVTLTYPGGEIQCSVTLWFTNGTWGTHGTPLDVWLSGEAVRRINRMHEACREVALEAIRNAAAEVCKAAD